MSQMDSEASGLAGVAIVLMATSTVTVMSRFWQRRKLSNVRPDDWVMLASWMIFAGTNVLIFLGIYNGSGLTVTQGEAYEAAEARGRLIWYLKEVLYPFGVSLARASICIFFGYVTDRKIHIAVLWLALISTAIVGIVSGGVVLLQCLPVAYYWNQAYLNSTGSCIPSSTIINLGYLYSAACAAIDLTLCLLPIDLVRRTNLERRDKILFVLTVGIASIGGIAPLIRLAYMTGLGNVDYIHSTVPGFCVWSAVEYGVAITAASLAATQPLPWELGSHRRTSSLIYDPSPISISLPVSRRLTETTFTTSYTRSTLKSMATTTTSRTSEKCFI